MKELKKRIKKKLPFHLYRHLIILSIILIVLTTCGVVTASLMKKEAVAYQVENKYDYMYLDVQSVIPVSSELYIVDDGEYVYVYSDDSGVNKVSSLKRVEGSLRILDEEEYQKLLPIFQKSFPELKVQTIEQMSDYIGNTALDHQMTGYIEIVILLLGVLVGLGLFLIILIFVIFYNSRKSSKCLQYYKENNELNIINEQMNHPLSVYSKIKAMVLNDYIVFNHPLPYVINFKDIQWIYIEKSSILFVIDREIKIVVYDQSLKRTVVMNASGLFSSHKKEANAILEQIASLYPNLLVGYTDENKEKFQQIKKGL